MTLTYKGFHFGVWGLCVVGLYWFFTAIEKMMTRPVATWGDDNAR